MQPQVTSGFLKKNDVCAQLGISPRTLENLVLTNQFPPAVRVGRWAYWSAKVLDDWHRRQFAVQEAWRPV